MHVEPMDVPLEPPEPQQPVDVEAAAAAVGQLLSAVGEDPAREGLRRTPHRVASMYRELLAGHAVDPETLVGDALFSVAYDEMVVVKDVDFYSLCEHHLLPFFGKAHIAYVPGEHVLGLSKIPRIVEMYARRLQVQERMTVQIARFLEDAVAPRGVAVVINAMHMCAMMRGVKKDNAAMTTSAMLGSFRDSAKTRSEFLSHLKTSEG